MTAKEQDLPDRNENNNGEEEMSIPDNHSIDPKTAGPKTGDSSPPPQERSTIDSPPSEGKAAASPDPFDPEQLRLSQDFGASLGVKRAMLTVPVRKPDKTWWVRTHPDQAYHVETAVIELKEDREVYLVDRELWPELATEATFAARSIFTSVNRQGVVFLWPIRLPGPDGKQDDWSRSALEAAIMAQSGWVRVQANMSLGAYEVWEATGVLPDPDWPAEAFSDLLRIAFKNHYVETLDHPVLKRLRGEE